MFKKRKEALAVQLATAKAEGAHEERERAAVEQNKAALRQFITLIENCQLPDGLILSAGINDPTKQATQMFSIALGMLRAYARAAKKVLEPDGVALTNIRHPGMKD